MKSQIRTIIIMEIPKCILCFLDHYRLLCVFRQIFAFFSSNFAFFSPNFALFSPNFAFFSPNFAFCVILRHFAYFASFSPTAFLEKVWNTRNHFLKMKILQLSNKLKKSIFVGNVAKVLHQKLT